LDVFQPDLHPGAPPFVQLIACSALKGCQLARLQPAARKQGSALEKGGSGRADCMGRTCAPRSRNDSRARGGRIRFICSLALTLAALRPLDLHVMTVMIPLDRCADMGFWPSSSQKMSRPYRSEDSYSLFRWRAPRDPKGERELC